MNNPINLKDRNIKSKKNGFTLVEMLVVAPIIILMIVVFIGAMITMTGDVLATRASSALSLNIQDALSRIEQDVKSSGGYLSSNNILLTSPQGYNNDTTKFHNANSANDIGDTLILNSYATTKNPISSSDTVNLAYLSDQPNACGSTEINKNPLLMMNVIYFIKDNTLWRRVVASSDYETISCVNGVVGTPWQKPSCAPGYSSAFCKAEDIKLVENVDIDGFVVEYFTTPTSASKNIIADDSSKSDDERLGVLKMSNTVKISISATKTIAGREVKKSSSIRATSRNNKRSANQFIEVLVVAGGGGGGSGNANYGGGGGGGGGLVHKSKLSILPQSYYVTVGGGGSGSTAITSKGNNGGNSSFSNSVIAIGGGGGGSYSSSSGSNGGSGGGSTNGWFAGLATTGQGFSGGIGSTLTAQFGGGGGGGSSSIGSSGSATSGGSGGSGLSKNISGSAINYAGGGGGGSFSTSAGSGGSGGGGNGGTGGNSGSAGTANLGGGGGASGGTGGGGGNGGSGIVIIKYLTDLLTATGGTITYLNSSGGGSRSTPAYSGGYTVHTFNSSGNFTIQN